MSDQVGRFFDDLPDLPTFPGKRPLKDLGPAKPPPKEEEPEWDAKPRIIGGAEYFSIGDLSGAVGKSVQTLRLWERQGILPPARWRTPPVKQGTLSKKGQRLYKRHQVELVRSAVRTYRIDTLDKPDWNGFRDALHAGWIPVG